MHSKQRASVDKVRRSEKGQVILEFSIVMPFIVFLMLVMVDLGRALHQHMMVSHIAAEGVRTGISLFDLNPNADYDDVWAGCIDDSCPTHTFVQRRVRLLLNAAGFSMADEDYEIKSRYFDNLDLGTPVVERDTVVVKVGVLYRPILNFLNLFNDIWVSAQARGPYLYESDGFMIP